MKKETTSQVMVTVLCLSYNQKEYIKQCLDSMLVQKTDFDFEILINDDNSIDGTKEIIQGYQKRHPDIIKPTFHKENQYSQGKRNMIARYLLPKARGKYLALCEGDDFWIDEKKLQKQVDFMEKHPDYALCFHPVKVIYQDKDQKNEVFPIMKSGFTLKKLLQANYIQTNSVMYRARKREEYAELATDVMPGDWYLHLFHAQFGKIGFINATMSVYRKHNDSLWSSIRGNSEAFWTKFGVDQIRLYTELLKLYGNDTSYREVIANNIGYTVNSVLNETNDGLSIVNDLVVTTPESATRVIQAINDLSELRNGALIKLNKVSTEQNKLIHEQQVVINHRDSELAAIRNSRTWRARGKIRKLLGRARNND